MHFLSCNFRRLPLALGGAAALAVGLWLVGAPEPAHAAPAFIPALDNHASALEPIRDIQRWRPPIYQRGRTPNYPYVYRRGRTGGWDFYGGFVPYAKGDYGTQALQRSQYPDTMVWPPDMNVWQDRGAPRPKRR